MGSSNGTTIYLKRLAIYTAIGAIIAIGLLLTDRRDAAILIGVFWILGAPEFDLKNRYLLNKKPSL